MTLNGLTFTHDQEKYSYTFNPTGFTETSTTEYTYIIRYRSVNGTLLNTVRITSDSPQTTLSLRDRYIPAAQSGGQFQGWALDNSSTECVDTITITHSDNDGELDVFAVWKYQIIWKVENTTQSEYVLQGTTPVYPGLTPTKAGDVQYSYSFAGWTPTPVAVTGVATYTAQFNRTTNKYWITFVDEDGTTILQNTQVEYGTRPVYSGPTPTKASTPQYEYAFNGWDKSIQLVTQDDTYTATYRSADRYYTITWKDYDDSVLQTDSLRYGASPSYGSTPARDPTAEYTYAFSDWSPAVHLVAGDQEYVAQYTPTPRSYTLTWNYNNGSSALVQTVAYGTAITEPADPTRVGYDFAGWGTVPATMPAHNVTLNAVWDILSFTITFDTAGGSSIASITLEYDSDVTAPEAPTKTGYTFGGWYRDGEPYTLPEKMPAENIACVAHWDINTYTLRYMYPAGTVYRAFEVEYSSTQIPVPPVDPIRTGYTFDSWTGVPEVMPAGDVECTATWIINRYEIKWIVEGQIYESDVLDYGADITRPDDPVKTGYTFAGWGQEIPATMPAANVTFTASFEINTYKLTFDANGGTFEGNRTEIVIEQEYGTDVTAPIPGWAAHEFQRYTSSRTEGVPETMPDYDDTFTAQWEDLYTITLNANGGSIGGYDTWAFTAIAGTPIQYPEGNPIREGYDFGGWSGTLPSTMPDGGATYRANWDVQVYTLVVNYNGHGENVSVQVSYGADLQSLGIDFNPRCDGYTFSEWLKDGEHYDPSTMPAEDLTCVAQWEVNKYHITLRFNDGTTPDEVIEQYYDTAISVDDPTRVGYKFIGWNPPIPQRMPANNDTVCIAQWQRIYYTVTYSIHEGIECEIGGNTIIGPATTSIYVEYDTFAPLPRLTCTLPTSSDTGDEYSEDWDYTRIHKEWEYDLCWMNEGERVTEQIKPTDNTLIFSTRAPEDSKVNEITTTWYGWILTYDYDGFGTNKTVKVHSTSNVYTVTETPTAPAASSQFDFYCWSKNGADLSVNPELAPGAHTLKAIWVAYAKLQLDSYSNASAMLISWMETMDSSIEYISEESKYRTKVKIRKGTSHTYQVPELGLTTYDLVTRTDYYFTGYTANSVSVPAGSTDSTLSTTWGQYTVVCREVGGTAYTQYTNAGAGKDYTISYTPSKAGYEFRGWDESAQSVCYCAADAPEPGSRASITSVSPVTTITLPTYAPGYENAYQSNILSIYAVWYQYYHRIDYVSASGEQWTWGGRTTVGSTVWDATSSAVTVQHVSDIPQRSGWWFRKYVITNASGGTTGNTVIYRTYYLRTVGSNEYVSYYWTDENHQDGAAENAVTDLGSMTMQVGGDARVYLKPVGVQFKYRLEYYWDWGSSVRYGDPVEQTAGVPCYATAHILIAGPNPEYGTADAGKLDGTTVWYQNHPLFRGWAPEGAALPTLAGTLWHPGDTSPVVQTVPTDKEAVTHKFYARYVRDGDLYTWTAKYYLQPAEHFHAQIGTYPADRSTPSLDSNGKYTCWAYTSNTTEKTITLVGKSENSWVKQTLYTYGEGSLIQGLDEIYTNTQARHVFQGFYYSSGAPSDNAGISIRVREVVCNTNYQTINVYPIWFVKPRLVIQTYEAGSQNDHHERVVVSPDAYGWNSEGKLNSDSSLAVTLWTLSELGYPDGRYDDEKTLVGLAYGASSFSFGSTFTVPISSMNYSSGAESICEFRYEVRSEPKVTLYIENPEIFAPEGISEVSPVEISLLADQKYYYGIPVIFTDDNIKQYVLGEVTNQYKYVLASWEIYKENSDTPYITGTDSTISFTPQTNDDTSGYRIIARYDNSEYTLNVHVKYDDPDSMVPFDWIASFTIKYAHGVMDAGGITRTTIYTKLRSAYPDAGTQIDAALPSTSAISTLSQDEAYHNEVPARPLSKIALRPTTDSFSTDGRDVSVYAQFGSCPTGITLSDRFSVSANILTCSAEVAFPSGTGLKGDPAAEMYCAGEDADRWTYSYIGNTTRAVGTLVPGQHVIKAKTAAPAVSGDQIVSSGTIRACTVKVNFANTTARPRVNLPQPIYSTRAEWNAAGPVTAPTVNFSNIVASANVRGWVFGGWALSTAPTVPITEFDFSTIAEYEITLVPLWNVCGVFRFGQGTYGDIRNNVTYDLTNISDHEPIPAGATFTYVIPLGVEHPNLEFDSWVCTDIEGYPIEPEAGTTDTYVLGPGIYTFTVRWKRRDLMVSWAKLVPRGGAVALSDDDPPQWILGTYISSEWALAYVPSEEISSPITFNAEGKPSILRTNFLPTVDTEYIPVRVTYGVEDRVPITTVWKTSLYLPDMSGQTPEVIDEHTKTITNGSTTLTYVDDVLTSIQGVIGEIYAADIPEMAFEAGPAVDFEPGTVFTGNLVPDSTVASFIKVTKAQDGTKFTIETMPGKRYEAGTQITLAMAYSSSGYVLPDIEADDLDGVEFIGFEDRTNVGNWARISNANACTLYVNLLEQPAAVRTYEIRTNRMNVTYFTEVSTPMIRSSTAENVWLNVNKDTSTMRGWGCVTVAPRATPGRYAAVFTIYTDFNGNPIEHAYIVTFEVIGGYATGPLCELAKYVKVNGTTEYSHLYLARPDAMNLSVTSVERSYQAKLTTIPILTKSSEYNYCIDLGTKEMISFTVSRTPPNEPDDDSQDECMWTNRKWLDYVKTFFDEWQNLNYDASGKRAGGYGLVYDPHSDAALPVMHKNVFMSAPLEYRYGRAVVNLSFQFTVASMLGRSAANNQTPFTVVYIYVTKSTRYDQETKEWINTVGREDKPFKYYRDTFTISDLPSGDGFGGSIGWAVYTAHEPGINAILENGDIQELEDGETAYRAEAYEISDIQAGFRGIFMPGAEMPCSPGEVIWCVMYCGKIESVLPVTESLSCKMNIAALMRDYQNKEGYRTDTREYYMKITLVGGGGGGGPSELTASALYITGGSGARLPKRDKTLSEHIFTGDTAITSSCLGGGGTGGACKSRTSLMSDITYDSDGQFFVDVVIGDGGSCGNDGGRTSVIYTLGNRPVNLRADGGGGGKLKGAGVCRSGVLQFTGGEHQALENTEWKFGSGLCTGQDGSPPGRGGVGQTDAFINGKPCYPSCGGGASGIDSVYADGTTEWWAYRHGVLPGDEMSGYPGGNDDKVGLIQGEEVTISLTPGEHAGVSIGKRAAQVLNWENILNFRITSVQIYRNNRWEDLDENSSELKIITSEGHELRNGVREIRQGVIGNSQFQITGRLIGIENTWYRINWYYEVSSVSNALGNLLSGKLSTRVPHTRVFDFKIVPAVYKVGPKPGVTSYRGTGAYCEMDSSNNYVVRDAQYGGGGCSTLSTAVQKSTSSGKTYKFQGSPGAKGLVLFEVISIPKGVQE